MLFTLFSKIVLCSSKEQNNIPLLAIQGLYCYLHATLYWNKDFKNKVNARLLSLQICGSAVYNGCHADWRRTAGADRCAVPHNRFCSFLIFSCATKIHVFFFKKFSFISVRKCTNEETRVILREHWRRL